MSDLRHSCWIVTFSGGGPVLNFTGEQRHPSQKLFRQGRKWRHSHAAKETPMPAPDTNDSIAQLSQSVRQALNQNRALFEQMAHFTRDESLRLAHAQLDQADHAFAKVRARHDLSGLIDAHQDWVRQTMQEYAALSLRYAEMFHSLAQHVRSQVESAASDLQHHAEDAVEDLGQMASDMVRPRTGIRVEHPHMPAE
jgi:hypothetical protein